ncbi:MAG: uracil-DNA glycosylase [Lachnospiraceae bacterium]|nr:uracil-DNA glycosylase [Lachnospiraceae bacterium]
MQGLWHEKLKNEFRAPYYKELYNKVNEAYRTGVVYPPQDQVFSAFAFTPYEELKVVILGQDPYHNPGEANGLAFSVSPGIRIPPSLKNIYKELSDDLGCYIPNTGDLTKWARQGVLLLNTSLTVIAHAAGSMLKTIGWERFTDAVIKAADEKEGPLVFMLWGRHAQAKKALLENKAHLVLEAKHPSPLAGGGFFGCKHFSKANDYLVKNGVAPIDWQIENVV